MQSILLIIDDRKILEILETSFKSEGYTVIIPDRLEGKEMTGKFQPDLILTDKIPGTGNREIFNDYYTAERTIPFIFINEADKLNVEKIFPGLRIVDYITNTFEIEDIIRAVNLRLGGNKFRFEQAEAIISHLLDMAPSELRNTLVPILGYSEYINGNLNLINRETIKKMSGKINESSKHLLKQIDRLSLINEIKHLCEKRTKVIWEASLKIDDNYVQSLINKNNFLARSFCFFEISMQDAKLRIYTSYLTILLHELLENAVKYSIPNSIIKMKGEIIDNCYQISIINRGINITIKEVRKFSCIRQFNSEPLYKNGRGNGLALAEMILILFNGTLEIGLEKDSLINTKIHLALNLI